MKMGTRSLLFGVHQVLWHPITVWCAWRELYGKRPTWRETVCIIVHDWGYWGCAEMDGPQGKLHPYVGARIASWLLDEPEDTTWKNFCLGHSRRLSKLLGAQPSKLCWADKLSIAYDPHWFYLPRSRATGELREYRQNADRTGFLTEAAPDRCWHRKLVEHERNAALKRRHEHAIA